MKKNFVKKTLASTLAFAMVATSVPAAFTTASAATKAPALNRKTKTLYINDNEIGSSYNFNVKNQVKGSTYKWTTSNKAIATVNSKNGVTKAGTKTGKATITCKITFKTKKTKTLKATVTVKENATKVWVKNAPEKEIGIGASAYDFNSSFSTESGAKATDYRTWEIDAASNTAGATIDAKTGVVTTTKAGSFKVRVRAYQNKAKLAANDTVDSDWLEVKVVSSITAVAQTVTNKVKVTFDDNMKDKVKASDFVIKNKATTAVQQIKGISFSDDGKEVTIETYLNFVDAGTYTLTYSGVDKEFTTSIGEVASLQINPSTVVAGTATKVEVKAFNANGVDITSEKGSSITIEDSENADGWLNNSTSTPELTIFKVGSTAKIKATYHTYKYDNTGKEEGAVTAEAVITAVDKAAATYTLSKYVIANTTDTVNFDKVTDNTGTLCVEEPTQKALFVKIVGSDGKEITNYADLTATAGDDNVLLANYDAANKKVVVTAVKEGSTVVIFKDKDGKAVITVPVVVKAKRAATTVVLDKNTISVTNNAAASVATNSTKATVKDQYNENLNTKVGVNSTTLLSKPSKATTTPTIDVAADGTIKATVDSTVVVGTYQYKVYSTDDSSKFTVLNVTVKAVDTTSTAINYRFEAADTKADTIVTKAADADKTIKLTTVKTQGGVDADVLASGTGVTYTAVDKDGKAANGVLAEDANGNAVFVVNSKNGNLVNKTASGVYTISATVKQTVNGVTKDVVIGKQTIIVTDTQPKVNFKANSIATDVASTDLEGILNDTCEFYYDGKTYKAGTANTVTYGEIKHQTIGAKVYISTAKVNITVDGVIVSFTVDINTTFTTK